ncbi:MarR family winged helix-turn-helix transcriptional regulator [Microbacterium sp. YY-03]|uniref:MarR family winged helix-turn-helix transcriptional regulator n=1 Tax=Microbacterium sp. YY-03 TaxID=3421636 RepID=UPI003D172B57
MTKPTNEEIDAIAAALAAMRSARGGPRGMRPGMPRHSHDDHDDHAGHPHHGHPGVGGGGRGERGGRHAAGPARMRMLEALAAAGEPMSISAIAELIGVDQPRASRLVQQAELMGFVAREVDPEDARRMRVALTDQGRAVATSMRRDRRDRIGVALEQFTAEERADFARLFTMFATAWANR